LGLVYLTKPNIGPEWRGYCLGLGLLAVAFGAIVGNEFFTGKLSWDGVIAAGGVVLVVAVPVCALIRRRIQTRITIKHLPLLADGPVRGPIVLPVERDHEILLEVTLRNSGPIRELDVECLNETPWLLPGGDAPLDAVRIDTVSDTHDLSMWESDEVAHRYLRYDAPVVKGVRPFALKVHILALKEWRGFISVRDRATGREGHIAVLIVRP
jgi:hypothetical protein